MNDGLAALITLAALVLMGVLLLVGGIFIARSIVTNMRGGLSFRAALAARIDGLRLNKMLKRLGINRSDYLHGRSVVDIDRHIRVCGGCQAIDVCDAKLADSARIENYDFCPNHESLVKLVDPEQARTGKAAS